MLVIQSPSVPTRIYELVQVHDNKHGVGALSRCIYYPTRPLSNTADCKQNSNYTVFVLSSSGDSDGADRGSVHDEKESSHTDH